MHVRFCARPVEVVTWDDLTGSMVPFGKNRTYAKEEIDGGGSGELRKRMFNGCTHHEIPILSCSERLLGVSRFMRTGKVGVKVTFDPRHVSFSLAGKIRR